MKIKVYRDLMGANAKWAAKTRALLAKNNVRMINLIGAPGAGKTALLERTVKQISSRFKLGLQRRQLPRAELAAHLTFSEGGRRASAFAARHSTASARRRPRDVSTLKFLNIKFAVLEGDIATKNDSARLARLGCRVSQLLTGGACHLEAKLVHYALRDLPLAGLDLVIVENVGNLVCPAEFDIGEHAKVVVLSVTEGEDKPLKYPTIFREACAVVITKTDLLPYVPFQLKQCLANIRRINPRLDVFQVSAVSGRGIKAWIEWLSAEMCSL